MLTFATWYESGLSKEKALTRQDMEYGALLASPRVAGAPFLIVPSHPINIFPSETAEWIMLSIYDSLSRDASSAADSLSVMLQKEQTVYKSCDYLARTSLLTASDRMVVVDWCYSVIDAMECDRNTVGMVSRTC